MAETLDMRTADPGLKHGESNQQLLIGWLMRKLGHPSVRIELSEQHYIDNLNEALQKFVGTAERPEKFFQFVTTRNVGVYDLPTDFVGMHEQLHWIPDAIINYIQTYTAYQMYVNFTGNLDVSVYHAIMEHLQMKVNQIGGTPTWEILYNPPRIKIYPTPQQNGRHVVFPYVAMPRLEDWTPQLDLMGYDWVRRYALMLCKEILGRIRGRYGNIVTVGDMPVNQDADVLLAEAKEERTKLDEELEGQRYVMPIIVF